MGVRILSHARPGHMDDILAIGLVCHFINDNDIEIVRSNNETNLDDFDFVIDIGQKYDNDKYFDHHHDRNLESSFLLILKKFSPEYYEKAKNLRVVKFIDLKDRYGPVEALNKIPEMKGSSEYMNFLSFIIQDINNPTALADIGQAFLNYIDHEYMKEDIAKQTILRHHDEYRVVICKHRNPNIGFLSQIFEPDIIIAYNVRTPGAVSIIKNSNSPDYEKINIDDLAKDFEVVFRHKNGFMKVVKSNDVEEVFNGL